MRSERLMIACIRCSIISTETPLSRILRTSSIIFTTSVGFRPASTSSSNRSLGFAASALATSRRFLPAMVSERAIRPARSPNPTCCSTSEATLRAAAKSRYSRPKHAPTVTLSSTVRSFKGFTTWCVRARPKWTTLSREGDGSLVGLVDPIHDIEQGCLPGAVGTDQAHDLALGDAETDVGNRYQPTETLRDPAHFQDGIHSITLRARGSKR